MSYNTVNKSGAGQSEIRHRQTVDVTRNETPSNGVIHLQKVDVKVSECQDHRECALKVPRMYCMFVMKRSFTLMKVSIRNR